MLSHEESHHLSVDDAKHQDARGLWHDASRYPLSLGCAVCRFRETCGGLNLRRPVYECLDFCCGRPEDCDSVCTEKPLDFRRRVWEVDGFQLENVPRARQLPSPSLPSAVPLLYHGSRRIGRFSPKAVALPLYDVIRRRTGTEDEAALARTFGFSPSTPVILTGTADDRDLEPWWSRSTQRLEVIRKLRSLNITLVTTPNFSLFCDQPRWDDLHSMKRIAIAHEEFLREGIPAALHVNARTDHDWKRWCDYVRQRPEVTHLAFEFATGAGNNGRVEWHVAQLARLAEDVDRPLNLIVRGGRSSVLKKLVPAFDNVTVVDTTVFMKTVNRQRAERDINGDVQWLSSPTDEDAPLDELLANNWWVVRDTYRDRIAHSQQVEVRR